MDTSTIRKFIIMERINFQLTEIIIKPDKGQSTDVFQIECTPYNSSFLHSFATDNYLGIGIRGDKGSNGHDTDEDGYHSPADGRQSWLVHTRSNPPHLTPTRTGHPTRTATLLNHFTNQYIRSTTSQSLKIISGATTKTVPMKTILYPRLYNAQVMASLRVAGAPNLKLEINPFLFKLGGPTSIFAPAPPTITHKKSDHDRNWDDDSDSDDNDDNDDGTNHTMETHCQYHAKALVWFTTTFSLLFPHMIKTESTLFQIQQQYLSLCQAWDQQVLQNQLQMSKMLAEQEEAERKERLEAERRRNVEPEPYPSCCVCFFDTSTHMTTCCWKLLACGECQSGLADTLCPQCGTTKPVLKRVYFAAPKEQIEIDP